MIGGVETYVRTGAGTAALEAAVRAIRQHWPGAVFENGDRGDKYDEFWQVPFGELSEIFVYRDHAASQGWDEDGAVPELYNTMVHLIADDGITVVVDEKDIEMDQLIATISSALSDNILNVPALQEAV